MVSVKRETIAGVWGQSPQRDPGAKHLLSCSVGQGAKPPEAGGILISHAKNKIETEKDRFT